MPWPMWHREMTVKQTSIFHKESKTCVIQLKTLSEGEQICGYKIPKVTDGYVGIDIRKGFNCF